MAGVSGQIESGQLLLPEETPWLAEFKFEFLGFPTGRHDDQADALTQLIDWALRSADHHLQPLGAGPILFFTDDDGCWRQQVGDCDRITPL